MRVGWVTWTWRVLWFLAVVTTGEVIGLGADGRTAAVRVTATALAWAVWAAGLVVSLIPHPTTLTALRMLAPVPLLGVVWAAVAANPFEPDPVGLVGIAVAALLAVVAFAGDLGADFVNGASYGDERRLPLRPPTSLLFGPVPLAWAIAVPLPIAGLLLLAAEQWVAGAVVALLGAGGAYLGVRSLHRLAGRWAVLVPAGLTIVDNLVLLDPVLLPRAAVRRLGPAVDDEGAADLTLGASGLILRADLDEPVTISRMRGRDTPTPPEPVRAVLFAPSRPGRLLEAAESRRLRVSRG